MLCALIYGHTITNRTYERQPAMNATQAVKNIRTAIDRAPRNDYTAELHLQMIKYADVLQNVTGKEFCEMLGIGSSFGVEFNKMRKIAVRLQNAGLNPDKI